MEKKSKDFSIEEAAALAQSEVGQQLLHTLQSQNNNTVQQAMAQAAAGDYGSLQKTVSQLLASPEIRALLEQLGGNL